MSDQEPDEIEIQIYRALCGQVIEQTASDKGISRREARKDIARELKQDDPRRPLLLRILSEEE